MLGAAQSEKCMMGEGETGAFSGFIILFFSAPSGLEEFFTAIALHGIF